MSAGWRVLLCVCLLVLGLCNGFRASHFPMSTIIMRRSMSATGSNMQITDKMRVDAYLEIKKLRRDGLPVGESLIHMTGRESVEEVNRDLDLVAQQLAVIMDRTRKEDEEIERELASSLYAPLRFRSLRVEVPYDRLEEIEERECFTLLHKQPPLMDGHKRKLREALEKYQRHPTDVGSPEVQVSRMNERIKYLAAHLLRNKKDFVTKRSLLQIVQDRRKMLNYLYKKDPERAISLAAELGIRFRPPARVVDRSVRYATFHNTKSRVAKKLRVAREARRAAGLGPRVRKVKGIHIPGFQTITKLY